MATNQINVILTGLKNLTSQTVTKLTLDITKKLKQDTPVDTGWARANWIPSIGSPSDFSGEKPHAESPDVQGAEAASEAGSAQMLGYTIDAGPAFVSNNVPYIQLLNEGSSTKAPSGFVEAAIEQTVVELKAGK